MGTRERWILILLIFILGFLWPAAAALGAGELGRIEGTVAGQDGTGLGGVRVVVGGIRASRTTDVAGHYAFNRVAPGTYTLTFTLAGHNHTRPGVAVTAGDTARVDEILDWELAFADEVTVFSASRRRERIAEAPAAVTTVVREEIEREAAAGQLPKLLEFSPGAELTQGSLYEFNLNVRGVNDPANRRVLTLIDGRDASLPSLGSQEWAALSYPLDDLQGLELVRGPGSALYGADAFNGVLNIITKAPREYRGGTFRLTAGELDTGKLDARYAAGLGRDWYVKALGGFTRSADFSRSRTASVEYSVPCAAVGQTGCLPLEAVAPVRDETEIAYGSLRLDKYFAGGVTATLETGTASFDGPISVSEFGRYQVADVERPWARLNASGLHWNALAYYNGRSGRDQIFLSTAYPFFTSSGRLSLELQGHTDFAEGRGFLVGGASIMEETLDSAGPGGNQTVTFRERDEDFESLFGQVEYSFTDRLRGVLAARLDDTSLHGARSSPRASLVWAVAPEQTLRFSYSEAFLTPSYVQFFLYLPVAPALDLRPFEGICALGGVACGFGEPVAIRAVGNETVEVEEIRSFELGYNAVLGKSLWLTADLFSNRIENFISDFIAYFNPALGGRIHGNYAPYRPPPELADPLASQLLASLEASLPPEIFAVLSNGAFGEPFLPFLSVVNFGRVDTRGFEVAVMRPIRESWRLELGYAYFDFDVREELPEDPALPNASKNRANVGLSYVGDRLDAALRWRWVEGFDWSAGLYRGHVRSYDVMDLTVNFELDRRWGVGLAVSNLFDSTHYEFFGADLLRRRALVHVTFSL